jgi:predicted TIM-barrel fold metal-dependent hydrolase
MGITDCHVHINPVDEMRPEARALLTRLDAATVEMLRDPRGLLGLLDRSGIERAVLINYVSPKVIGYTERTNDFVSEYVKADPDRLIAVGGIRPDHTDPEAEVARLADRLGLRAIKIHPPHQLFAPNDYLSGRFPALRRIYAAIEDRGLPLIVHTGTSIFPGARNRYGEPLLVEDVAIDFPRLPIVLAHAGRPLWVDQAAFLARRFPNVWLELSGIPPPRLLEYLPRLGELAPKSIFGTDWPGPGVTEMRKNIDGFRSLGLTPEQERMILEENPRKVFPPR